MSTMPFNQTASGEDKFPNLTGDYLAVGIDLGTTNSVVSFWSNEKLRAKVIKVEGSNKTLPSVVAFEKDGRKWKPCVGRAAVERGATNPASCVRNVKRLMGQQYDSPAVEKLLEEGTDSYEILPLPKGDVEDSERPSKLKVEINDQDTAYRLFPEEVSACILTHLKTMVELYLKDKQVVRFAVITVPAHFNHSQRLATLEAAHVAGFEDARILSEPTAAAIAYGLGVAGEKNVFVFDLGGGTFDTSILHIQEGNIDVLSTLGDPRLGGNDVDAMILSYALKTLALRALKNVDDDGLKPSTVSAAPESMTITELYTFLGLTSTSPAFVEIQRACEHAKIELTRKDKTYIVLEGIRGDLKFPVDSVTERAKANINIPLSQKQLEEMMVPFLAKCKCIVEQALLDVDMAAKDIDEIVLVGGVTRMPAVHSMVQSIFPGKVLCKSINPDEVVAEGAAIRAAMLAGVDNELLKDVLMIDVLPTSIGLEAANGSFIPLLPRLSKIPCRVSKSFGTYEDNQAGITVKLFEGEHQMASDNHEMGTLDFFIPKDKRGKKGETEVEVTFHLKYGGIIHVTTNMDEAADADTGETLRFVLLLLCAFGLMALLFYLKANPLIEKDDVQEKVDLWGTSVANEEL